MPLRIAYFGSSEFSASVMEALARDSRFEIVIVITQPDSVQGRKREMTAPPVKKAALRLGLAVWQPKSLKGPKATEKFLGFGLDFGVVVAYGKIVPEAFLNHPVHGFLNGHASDLPRWRGAAPIHRAILNQDRFTAMTIMQMTPRLDDGPVLLREQIPIGPEDGFLLLESRLLDSCFRLLPQALLNYSQIAPLAQDHALACYAEKIGIVDGCIVLQDDIKVSFAKIRALEGLYGGILQLDGKKFAIFKARIEVENHSFELGSVVYLNRKGFGIALAGGILNPLEIQLEGKKRMHISAFMAGNQIGSEHVFCEIQA